jgi:flavodoxin
MDNSNNQSVFIFSTRGSFPLWVGHRSLKKKLKEKKFDILGEFSCKGLDTYGLLKLVGGINRGHPNQEDLENARFFAEGLR